MRRFLQSISVVLLLLSLSACSKRNGTAPVSAPVVPAPVSPEVVTPNFKAAEIDPLDFETPVGMDLLALQKLEAKAYSSEEIQKLNERTLEKFSHSTVTREVSDAKGERLNGINLEWAQKVMASIDRHPIVSSYQDDRYSRPGVEIGFCFGRATYVHLALLKMGVNKDAIKKIWIVGPLQTNVKWAFHVATMVKDAQSAEWYVIDNVPGQVLPVREWVKFLSGYDTQKLARIYISEPQKFSVSIGEYNRVEMGLNLPVDKDWYQHYFVDLLHWFKTDSLESVGLQDLRKSILAGPAN
jgi:hypothetical protein